jgi:hypothetical protein
MERTSITALGLGLILLRMMGVHSLHASKYKKAPVDRGFDYFLVALLSAAI